MAIFGVASIVAVTVITFSYGMLLSGISGPHGPREALDINRFTIRTISGQQKASNLTIWFRSTGYETVALSSIFIQDTNVTSSQATFPVSVSIPPQTVGVVSIDTSTSGLYFTIGHSYSVIVQTSSNHQFTLVITYQ